MMKRLVLGMASAAMISGLTACGVPAQPQASASGGFTVLDQRNYFHLHVGPYRIYRPVSGWTTMNTPEDWAGISGYVYGYLGTYLEKWWYIPSPYQGIVYGWNTDSKRWMTYQAGYDGTELRYVDSK
jgi:hypothetical protein